MSNLCTLVICGAPLASRAPDLANALTAAGWRVQVIATTAAREWVDDDALAEILGQGSRSQQRSPSQPKRRERAAAMVVAPMTFNSLTKLALGIADSLAHSAMCEALGEGLPIVAVPMVNQYLGGHPAWESNVAQLSRAGVTWVRIHDGSAGELALVKSGTGLDLVEAFDPNWVVTRLPGVPVAS